MSNKLVGVALALTAVAWVVADTPARAATTLLNVSYDPTRELYQAVAKAFALKWQAEHGEAVVVNTSNGGSGAQARAIIDGLKADIVTLALAADIDAIAAKTNKLPKDWQKRLPDNSTPYTSTIVFLVRKGNPKGINDWDDLVKPGVQVVTPNPKTSGGARWAYLAAWGYAQDKFGGDDGKVRDFVSALYHNVPVLDTGARGATTSFAQRGLGDVLLSWENEAYLVLDHFGNDKFEIVIPSESILAEPPVALVDANVDAKGSRPVAEALLQYLYSKDGQALIAKNFYRPRHPEFADATDVARFSKLKLFTIDERFGGWAKAQPAHFGDGGIFDQIYKPAN